MKMQADLMIRDGDFLNEEFELEKGKSILIRDGKILDIDTAEELENTCRKCVKLQLTDTAVLAHILDKRGLEYEILSDTQANVYGELVVSDVALELAEQNCRMFSVQEYEESLESYYLNLVGGGKHE